MRVKNSEIVDIHTEHSVGGDTVPLSNHFQILANVHDTGGSSQSTCRGTHASFHFRGNKNGNGQILGSVLLHGAPESKSMESFTDLKGNKNKTGQTLGNTMHRTNNKSDCYDPRFLQYKQHASSTFRGNKNGNGQILGSMLQEITNLDRTVTSITPNEVNGKTIAVSSGDVATSPQMLPNRDIPSHTETNDKWQGRHQQHYAVDCQIGDIASPYPVPVYKRKKSIPNAVIANKYQSLDHKNCINQNTKGFGFTPYNDLLIYTGKEIVWGNVPDIVQAHQLVKNSAMPHFMQVRIPVKSQLNVEAWKKYLTSYWDKQLTDLIQYGFPLDFDRKRALQSTYTNHASALKYSDHVSAYIQTEMQYGAIYGPFAQPPFTCHVSPFLTRDKPNSGKRRVILDLSFPPGLSVNDGVPKDRYLGSYFDLKYPSIDHIVDSLKEFGTDALLYKVDISRAF